jgi:hypothetical protein
MTKTVIARLCPSFVVVDANEDGMQLGSYESGGEL